MISEQHDFVSEFPQHKQAIHDLKTSNAHFAKLFEEYNKINREILRIETGVENTSDEYVEGLKKQRLKLKDELYQFIQKAA